MLPGAHRLRTKAEFERGYAKGRVARGKFCVIYYLDSGEPGKRVGVVVSRKLGTAVSRNRIKRRFRDAIRHYMAGLKEGARLILVARARARDAAFLEIESEMGKLLMELEAMGGENG